MAISEAIRRTMSEGAEKVRVRSALNPILWLCGIIVAPILVSQPLGELPFWAIILVCATVAVAGIGFLFLLLFDRDRLQSEDYQLRMRSLSLIQEKGEAFPIVPTSIQDISNPESRQSKRHVAGDLDQ